jgi:hypothetical protein
MEQRMETRDHQNAVGIERWQLQDQDGQELSMSLRYGIGIPVQTIGESKVRGGPDPDFSRIYRTDRGIDVVRSLPNAIDRVQEFNFRSTLSEFKEILDGSEQVVSISVEPWYMRQVFLHDKAYAYTCLPRVPILSCVPIHRLPLIVGIAQYPSAYWYERRSSLQGASCTVRIARRGRVAVPMTRLQKPGQRIVAVIEQSGEL